MIETVAAALLWISLGTVVYVYIGYPVLLVLFTLGRRYRPGRDLADSELPSVSFVVAAYNEEKVIEQKLRNCLTLDYPPDKLEFFFVSDSTDSTNDILRRYQSDRIHIKCLAERRGKLAAIGEIYPLCKREIVVLSDANTYYFPDAIRKLARHFTNPEVGVVTGDVRLLRSEQKFGQGESLYYKYERKLQELETSFWTTVGIDGAMYAIRRPLWQHSRSTMAADDLVTGMAVGRQGYRIIYDPEAIAEEDPTPTDEMEFRRKIRVITHSVQGMLEGEGVPRLTQGKFLWTYLSHKVLRWSVGVLLVVALVSALVLSFYSKVGSVMFAAQVVFYLLALVGWRVQQVDSRIFRVPYYFSMVNLAGLIGVVKGVQRKEASMWVPTRAQRG
ncbi:MAG: glycosyltransferase family 2 protein [Bryobacterales bacterium]|nr:glycosyltransferase family 2 protein [Bryobacterales bacterium]